MRLVNVVPAVIGARGSVTKKVEKWSEKLQVDANIGVRIGKNYLAGNSAHRKESFRTIRERSNLLALGHLLWPAQ